MTRAEKISAGAAGEIFDKVGWPYHVERRKRHWIMVVTPPDGKAVNLLITAARSKTQGTGAFVAATHARRLLNQHGVSA